MTGQWLNADYMSHAKLEAGGKKYAREGVSNWIREREW